MRLLHTPHLMMPPESSQNRRPALDDLRLSLFHKPPEARHVALCGRQGHILRRVRFGREFELRHHRARWSNGA